MGLGTMTFGWSQQTSSYVDESVAIEMVKKFIQFNEELYKNNETEDDDSNDTTAGLLQHRIDTARIYAGGKTEHIVGTVLEQVHAASPSTTFLVGTKAAPSVKPYGLSPEGMREQFATSMTALGGSSSSSSSLSAFPNGCAEYYLHQPDTDHPLLESLRCADALHKEQKIHTIGMSNYHVTEVARAFQLCREHDLTPPTVYQGLYNPLNRLVEENLLTGKHKKPQPKNKSEDETPNGTENEDTTVTVVAKGRFKDNPNYLPRFYADANFAAIRLIEEQCRKENITLLEASFRWLLCHSALDPACEDGFLLGASSVPQLEEILRACTLAATAATTTPSLLLSSELLQVFDDAWNITKADSPFPYWRSYSSDMPGREVLDQGASYANEQALQYQREFDGRIECKRKTCNNHLGHVFMDGPYEDTIDDTLLQERHN